MCKKETGSVKRLHLLINDKNDFVSVYDSGPMTSLKSSIKT